MSKLPIPKPLLALAAAFAVVIAASGCGTTTADVEQGRILFIERCGTCHVLAEAGASGETGPNLDHAFAAARASGLSDETIEGVVEAQIEYPRPSNGEAAISMPANLVEDQELDDVAAYVAEWAGVPGAAPPTVPGGPGAQVFANNGCSGCHTFKAAKAGGTTGPNLDQVLSGQSLAMIEESIVDPNKQIASGYSANVMPSTYGESLSPEEVKQLAEYLASGGKEAQASGKGGAGGSGNAKGG
ncbi:MAG TPA: cytochrome c [Solirubrobacterales bacterium]